MRSIARLGLLGIVLAAQAVLAAGTDIYRSLMLMPDATQFVTAPTTGLVSHTFTIRLENSGQQVESIEYGISAVSDSATWSKTDITNPVGPGQTQIMTLTVNGRGGHFPYWVDYWAQILGFPDTRQTARFTLDTTASTANLTASQTARPAGMAVAPLSGGRLAVTGATPGVRLDIYSADGRLVAVRTLSTSASAVIQTRPGLQVIRASAQGQPTQTRTCVVR